MHKVLVLGAGKIGSLIAGLLAESGDYDVQVADVDGSVARAVVDAHGIDNLHAHGFDAGDAQALAAHLAAHPVEAVISSLPFYCNIGVAEAARAALVTARVLEGVDALDADLRPRTGFRPKTGDES